MTTKTMYDTPVGLVAVLVAARRSGDRVLEATARDELKERYGITVKVGKDFLDKWRKEHPDSAYGASQSPKR